MTTWTPEMDVRAEAIIGRYPERRSAVMPLLYLVMHADGRLTDEGMRDVADRVGLTSAQVQAVASFYTMYKRDRVGRYLVSVCTSISCFLLGADDVLDAVADELGVPDGGTGVDGEFSVEHVECIGACGGAPAVQVNYELVEGVSADAARRLCQWVREARPDVVLGDEMQELFGGPRSFEWGPLERQGATGPAPAFEPYGTAGEQ